MSAAQIIQSAMEKNGYKFPLRDVGTQLINHLKDPWGNPLRYLIINSTQCRILSDGPDKTPLTAWDTGVTITYEPVAEEKKQTSILAAIQPDQPWLVTRKAELGIHDDSNNTNSNSSPFTHEFITGGQSKLEGASYFWFFTALMTITAILFIPVARRFKENQ